MPKAMHGQPVNEKAWQRAKTIVGREYPKLGGKGDRFYALVTTIYKSVCKSPEYACEGVRGYGGGMNGMNSLLQRLEVFTGHDGEADDVDWLSEISEEAALGKELLFSVVPRKDAVKFQQGLPKELQADFRKILEAMIDALTPKNPRVSFALRRLSNMVHRGPNPKRAPEELYKIADEIGVSLRR
jgi:hypothetical protein